MYLLDTNVISELRKARSGKANRNVVEWASSIAVTDLYLSVITVLELEMGILQLERRDPVQGEILRAWMNTHVLPTFSGRTLYIDIKIAKLCAKLHVPNPQSDRDALIAASALVHGMTVVTRNVSDFVPTGVNLLNPWN
jgi:predicted nucleic acid-binding protein